MKQDDTKDTADTDRTRRPGGDRPHKNGPLDSLEKTISHRERAVVNDEAAVLSREKSTAAREDATHLREESVDLREDAAHLREGSAQIREEEVAQRETAATVRDRESSAAAVVARETSDDLHDILKQANEHLVISTLEAQRLSDEVKTVNDELDHQAHHDSLTGLPNRIFLQDRLSQAIELAHRQGRQLAVMFMDLDQFKHINDSLGHVVGDKLLQSVAHRMVDCVRHSDTVSRQGGDEFVVLLSLIEHPEDAAFSAQKIVSALAEPHHIDPHDLQISVSIGISIYPDDGQDAETLIMNADAAMYHTKENGRNNYQFFKADMNARAAHRQSTETSLRQALKNQEFVLYYQPVINFRSGTIVGVEALIRWQHPELGLLSPAQFVPIAEECGLILPIGRWVLHEACRQAQAWLRAGLPPITVAVNTSTLEFRARDFLDNIRATLEDTGLEPRYLRLELTETVLMRDVRFANSLLHALSDMGVTLAVDDFGTGYSSLSYLGQFPVDTLKIDQSFVSRMTSNPDDAIIVSTVISMGQSLKKRIVAEGVETSGQYAFLLAQHCDEGQGFYFSQPLEADALAAVLQTGVPPKFAH